MTISGINRSKTPVRSHSDQSISESGRPSQNGRIDGTMSNTSVGAPFGTSSTASWGEYGTYGRKGQLDVPMIFQPTSPMEVDKGTAAWSTVNVSRKAFDSIVSATTGGDGMQWEELGVDENKRWVVINGQRFECEHSPEEKAARKRAQMTLMEYLDAIKKFKKEQKDPAKEPGNLDALKANGAVMDLIKKISGSTTDEGAIEWLHK